MNYKNAKQANKNFRSIVVFILALVLFSGLIAGLGFAFNWWGNTLPTSTYCLNIESIDEIVGLEFKAEDFTSTLNEKEIYAIQQGDAFDGTYPEHLTYESQSFLILDVQGYGVEYQRPDYGFYNVTIKLNGKQYKIENVEYKECSSEQWYALEGENESFFFGITDMSAVTKYGETDLVEGSSIGIHTIGFRLESFELVKFEKVS